MREQKLEMTRKWNKTDNDEKKTRKTIDKRKKE